MAQINCQYYTSETEKFCSVLMTCSWITMRYEGDPMAQINLKYYLSEADEFG